MLPQAQETTNQTEKNCSSDFIRIVVPTSKSKQCKEFDHIMECCCVGTTHKSGAVIFETTPSNSKDDMHKRNILKGVI